MRGDERHIVGIGVHTGPPDRCRCVRFVAAAFKDAVSHLDKAACLARRVPILEQGVNPIGVADLKRLTTE